MPRRAARLVAAVVLAVSTIAIVFLVGMRKKYPPVMNVVRRFNRAVVNPAQMDSAGTPGAYASVVRHTGRTTGSAYATPVQAVPIDDGFVIPLPYGPHTDWLQNVLASGEAEIVDAGETYAVEEPEIIPIAAFADRFPPRDRQSHQLFGVDECLRVRCVASAAPITAGQA